MADKETENFNSYIESADLPAVELEGDVKDTNAEADVKEVDIKSLDVNIDDVPNSSGEKEESGAEVVEKIQKEVLGESTSKEGDTEKKDVDIPDAFTNACLEQGWTEEEIKDFASDLDDAALLSLIPELLDKGEQKGLELDKGQAKQEVKAEAADKAAKPEPTNEELAIVKKELAEIKEQIKGAKEDKNAREQEATIQTVNQVFDEASKDFKIFGKTDELLKYPAGPKKGQLVSTSPAMVARGEVWDKAVPFIRSGIPAKAAMDIALTWYKGAYLEKDVQRNMIRDLKKHEKKLSAKRSGKETVKTYEDEEERQAEVVREAARKLGIKGKYGL